MESSLIFWSFSFSQNNRFIEWLAHLVFSKDWMLVFFIRCQQLQFVGQPMNFSNSYCHRKIKTIIVLRCQATHQQAVASNVNWAIRNAHRCKMNLRSNRNGTSLLRKLLPMGQHYITATVVARIVHRLQHQRFYQPHVNWHRFRVQVYIMPLVWTQCTQKQCTIRSAEDVIDKKTVNTYLYL